MNFIHNNLPAAASQNNNVLIELNSENDAFGRVIMIRFFIFLISSARPVRRAGERFDDGQILENIGTSMRRAVLHAARPLMPGRSDFYIRQNVFGNLLMTNWNTDTQTVGNSIDLGMLDGHEMSRLLELARAPGSAPDLLVYDVHWKFWINPASFNFGGVTKATKTVHGGMNSQDKRPKKHKDLIGCAALAICLAVEEVEKKFKTKSHKAWHEQAGFADWVLETQAKFGFTDPLCVPVLELEKALSVFPEYKLTVLTDAVLSAFHQKEGIDYHREKRLHMVIYYDYRQKHFLHIKEPQVYIKRLHLKKRICIDCGNLYTIGNTPINT